MVMSKFYKRIAGICIVIAVAASGFWFYARWYSFSPLPEGVQIAARLPDSFTFFDIGANTRFSSSVRKDLDSRLGSDAISYRGQIDLSDDNPDFLQKYFPDIYQLNLQLNYPPRERIEHSCIKLTYRYSQKVGVPFKYVEICFSGYSGRPLYCNVVVSDAGADVINTLYQKYGQPEELQVSAGFTGGRFWKKHDDVLLVSVKKDHYNKPEYHIMIYYVNTLQELLDIEHAQARQLQDRVKQAVNKAF